MVNPKMLTAARWRCIGPFRGGRVVAVAGDPTDPLTFYFGATAGGVWKSTDAGMYWRNVSDGFFRTAAVGAIAVADSDPNVVYAGMGEACIRHDSTHGDGVYGSVDGGSTWTHLGLEDTRRIGRIRVHPNDPDLVYVAALGHAYGPNAQRGVFRSRDGGATWECVLFVSEQAGAIDLSMDWNNPRILYASIFQVVRRPWTVISGGPDSGLWRSTDGGDTWVDISRNSGLPKGHVGRIGVASSPAKPGRVWALIEAEDGALFRSDDYGETWDRLSDKIELRERGWYYNHFFADTQDPETCYVQSMQAWKSIDGGRTWSAYATPHGDHHDLWIDPRNNRRMIEGSDGGGSVTLNGGEAWSTLYNQPTASIFHLDTDTNFPYRVYGTQMDNTGICVPSRSDEGVIPWKDCYTIGSSESGFIAVRPDNSDIVYSGALGSAPGGGAPMLRYDHRSGQSQLITVWPEVHSGAAPADVKHRFYFTFPIVLSPHDPDVLYTAAEVVFRSTDEGQSWEIISPDLTRNDREKTTVRSGGYITKENAGPADYYSTIYTMAESPVAKGVLWTGSDDGLIHLSRDGGGTWSNVTPAELEDGTLVSTIEASPHDPATAYFSATRYQWDDFRPIFFATHDYGATWKEISQGIEDGDFARVIREDPERSGLLYAGTETGVYVSFDDGGEWQPLQGNLPRVPIYDMAVKEGDLIAATHGRSFWVLDDLTPLHQTTAETQEKDVHLFKPRAASRPLSAMRPPRAALPGVNYHRVSGETATFYERRSSQGQTERVFLDAGENPPAGVTVTYYLKKRPSGEVSLTFLDEQGHEVRAFSSTRADDRVPAEAGTNRFAWDLYHADAAGPPGSAAMVATPGSYRVLLVVDGQSYEQPFEVLKDPRIEATQEDLEEQYALMVRIRAKLAETVGAIGRLREVRRQVEMWDAWAKEHSASGRIAEAAHEMRQQLDAVEAELTTEHLPNRVNLPPARLDAKLAGVSFVVATAKGRPTRQSYDVFEDVAERIDGQLSTLGEIIGKQVPAFIAAIREAGVPLVSPSRKR